MLFESCSFCLDLGKAVSFKVVSEFKRLITDNGGTVTTLLSAKVTCLVNSAFEYEVASSNLHKKARLLGVPIVSVEFLTQCVPIQRRLDARSLLHLYGKYAPAPAMVADLSVEPPSDPAVQSSLKFLRESEASAMRSFDACLMEIGHVFSALVADPQRVFRCCRDDAKALKLNSSKSASADDGMSDEEDSIEASECESVDSVNSTSSSSSTCSVAFRLSITDIALEFHRQRIFQQTNPHEDDLMIAIVPVVSPPFESFSAVPMQTSVQQLMQGDSSIDAPALIQRSAAGGPIDNSIEAIRARFQAQYNARLDEQADRKMLHAKIQRVAEIEKEKRIIARQAQIVSEEAQMKEQRERIRAQKKDYLEKKRIHDLLTKAKENGHILVDLLAFRPGDCLNLLTSDSTRDDSSGRAMLEQMRAQLEEEYEYYDDYDDEGPTGGGEHMWNKDDLSHYMGSNLFDLPKPDAEPAEEKQVQQQAEAEMLIAPEAAPVIEVEVPKATPAKKKKGPNPNPNYIGQKLFIGGLKFDDIYAMGKPENFDHHYDVWKEEKVNDRVQQRVELIKDMLRYFGEIILFEEKDLAKKGFLFVVYKNKDDANTAHKTIMNETLKTDYFEEERRRIRYSGVDMIIFPNKAEMYSSWPKHVKGVYMRKKKKSKK